jgi:DNA-binding XRE family transcriptional regulator
MAGAFSIETGHFNRSLSSRPLQGAMDDSEFWRNLAAQFLPLTLMGALSADWYCEVSNNISNWSLRGEPLVSSQFGSLARRGAMKLPNHPTRDLLEVWLEALRIDGDGFKPRSNGYKLDRNEEGGTTETLISQSGIFPRLCEASVRYCNKLESSALQTEFERMSVATAAGTAAIRPAQNEPKPETIGQQIKRLRLECRLTVEELAPQVNLEPRSVQRHESGKALPYPRYLAAYERYFSKHLKREVVIKKLS